MLELIITTLQTNKGTIDVELERLPTDDYLYATYCLYDNNRYCFHLMYDGNTLEFKLIDNHNCPDELQELVYLISRAIEHYHA